MASADKPPTKEEVWLDQQTKATEDAKAIVAAELHAARKKTEKLRRLRLAKEAGEGAKGLGKKQAASKKRAKATRRA